MPTDDDEGSGAGVVILLVFLAVFWFLRAVFNNADQTK